MQQASNMQTNADQHSSYSSHPGYVLNQITGQYKYGSGYQYDSNELQQSTYSQYTSAVPSHGSNQTTDSCNLNSSGDTFASQYSIQSNVEQGIVPTPTKSTTYEHTTPNPGYFTLPYGYQSTDMTSQIMCTTFKPLPNLGELSNATDPTRNSSTYMQSNHNNSTNTTLSDGYANSCISTLSNEERDNTNLQ